MNVMYITVDQEEEHTQEKNLIIRRQSFGLKIE